MEVKLKSLPHGIFAMLCDYLIHKELIEPTMASKTFCALWCHHINDINYTNGASMQFVLLAWWYHFQSRLSCQYHVMIHAVNYLVTEPIYLVLESNKTKLTISNVDPNSDLFSHLQEFFPCPFFWILDSSNNYIFSSQSIKILFLLPLCSYSNQ